jgi:hypothetical protein
MVRVFDYGGKMGVQFNIGLCGLLTYILYIYTFFIMHDLYCIINSKALQDT